jgi:hypothetical protein
MTAKAPAAGLIQCDYCPEIHEAIYSHDGAWNQGAVYVAVCGRFSDYYSQTALLTEVAPWRCDQCGRGFAKAGSLHLHKRRMHPPGGAGV